MRNKKNMFINLLSPAMVKLNKVYNHHQEKKKIREKIQKKSMQIATSWLMFTIYQQKIKRNTQHRNTYAPIIRRRVLLMIDCFIAS